MVVVVICLYSVFYEESVTHSVVRNVFFYSEMMYTMSSYGSVVGVVNCVTNNIRLVYVSNKMEVDRITTKLESLTDVLHFNITNVTNT